MEVAMSTKLADRVAGLLPEWPSFVEAVRARRPDDGTHCEAWTVRDIVAHNAGNAEELGRILAAYLSGATVPETRSFEEREEHLRRLPDPDLLVELERRVEQLVDVLEAAAGTDGEAMVPWTGRTMKVEWFGEHMREELVLHRWDVVGDDPVATASLSEPWMTEHSVVAVGRPLLRRGSDALGGGSVQGRLRSPGRDDVVVAADPGGARIALAPPEGRAVIESDPAARVLLLWGRRPADPGRLCSDAGPERLGLVRRLLSGY
jgi:uncharacterized protein (TIGR03083 family)